MANAVPWRKSHWSPDWFALFDSRVATNSWASFVLVYRIRILIVSYRKGKNLFKCTERNKENPFLCAVYVEELRVASSLTTRTDFIKEHGISS